MIFIHNLVIPSSGRFNLTKFRECIAALLRNVAASNKCRLSSVHWMPT